jgi:hypothetical protein
MEKTNFTNEELTQIKTLQEKYNALGIELVQLKISLEIAKEYLQSLQEKEVQLVDQIKETNTEEKVLAESLDKRYGEGSLDLESGEFTPKN